MNQRFHFKCGAIGGMLGLSGGASGTGFAGPTAAADQTGMRNLQNTYQQLQQVANGQGPDPAMAQYNQNIQNLAGQQAGAIGSIQGISPALAARMISQQGGAAMQNAAAAGAKTQAEQQLGALGQQATVANNQAGNAINQQNNINNANAGLASTGMQNQAGMMGGIMQGAGMALGMADGGAVPAMAPMAQPGPQSQFAQFLQGASGQVAPVAQMSDTAMPVSGPAALQKGASSLLGALRSKSPAPGEVGSQVGGGIGASAGAGVGMARGGKVPAMVSPGETYLSPQKVAAVAKGKNPLKAGERIPGKPKVAGNSYANDVVPKMLEAGGVVIPNSIMQSKDPAGNAMDFVAKIIAKRRGRK